MTDERSLNTVKVPRKGRYESEKNLNKHFHRTFRIPTKSLKDRFYYPSKRWDTHLCTAFGIIRRAHKDFLELWKCFTILDESKFYQDKASDDYRFFYLKIGPCMFKLHKDWSAFIDKFYCLSSWSDEIHELKLSIADMQMYLHTEWLDPIFYEAELLPADYVKSIPLEECSSTYFGLWRRDGCSSVQSQRELGYHQRLTIIHQVYDIFKYETSSYFYMVRFKALIRELAKDIKRDRKEMDKVILGYKKRKYTLFCSSADIVGKNLRMSHRKLIYLTYTLNIFMESAAPFNQRLQDHSKSLSCVYHEWPVKSKAEKALEKKIQGPSFYWGPS